MGDDPPFLPVGTDVSAKYKGAFCEAKIKKVVRNIKCKVSLKSGGSGIIVNDDVIKGTLRVGSTVEVKQDPKKDAVEAIITKIQDCSQYTVVFDDGDITTLRRTALCLKSGRHFNESETLDQLPLTHPEHFSTPVIAGRRGRRGRAQSDGSGGDAPRRRVREREAHVGRVVLVDAAGGGERRRPQPAFPALVVAPTPQIHVREDYLVRSFKDGRYYTVPKKEARPFNSAAPLPEEWGGVAAAQRYLQHAELPPHWDRDALFNEPRHTSDDSSDDEPREEKDHFVAQLYKFMDDRGTPLNRNPTIANKDIDLYRLFRVVQKLGGYNRVTNQNQWKTIAGKMDFQPVNTGITNLCKQAYKKFLHSFEDFYRKLGVTLVAHPRGARTPPAGRSLIRDRDRLPPTSSSASSTPTGTPLQRGKDSDKSETEKSEKEDKPDEKEDKPDEKEKKEERPEREGRLTRMSREGRETRLSREGSKAREGRETREGSVKSVKSAKGEVRSDGEDSADNQPLATTPKPAAAPPKDKPPADDKTTAKARSVSRTRAAPPRPDQEPRAPKPRRQLVCKSESSSTSASRASRRTHVSTDSDSSGRASRCGLTKKLGCRRSQSANSASSGNTVASTGSKRPRKRKTTEPSSGGGGGGGGAGAGRGAIKAQVGDKLKVYYGPTQSESKVTYEAKVIEVTREGSLRVHYTGWNTRYDEWIQPQRIAVNVSQYERAHCKKGSGAARRVRPKRTEESSARSDSTDSDSDAEVKKRPPPKKLDEKSNEPKTPSRPKEAVKSDASSGSVKARKRPPRPPAPPAPAKRARPRSPPGRDYDLNEIRSELKGLHTVKTETEEVKQEPECVSSPPPEPSNADKQPEDVYEFKEPEPFELELHDEKKKRTHRIFDDISPSKYTAALAKSLSEEIEDPLRSRPPLRSPPPSPYREHAPPGRRTPDDDKLAAFEDDDSFQDGSSGPIFEGFTPAKNQETYSKKGKVAKLRELIDDSPESPADDEQSSEDEPEKEAPRVPSPATVTPESSEPPDVKEELKEPYVDETTTEESQPKVESSQESTSVEEMQIIPIEVKEDIPIPEPIKPCDIPLPNDIPVASIPLPPDPPASPPRTPPPEHTSDEADSASPTKLELPSSPMDTEEEKSEPPSPARSDALPEPPPAFIHSEGPKIAEKLLKAISSARRLSLSPAPEERPKTPLKESPKPEVSPETKKEPKREVKKEPRKTPETVSTIFGEPSKMTDAKPDVTKVRPATPPRLQSPLGVLERRKSVAELPQATKSNNLLSDTIQKLSSQINLPPAAAPALPLPPRPAKERARSDSSDSEEEGRRLIIEAATAWSRWDRTGKPPGEYTGAGKPAGEWAGAGKSPGEWSATHSLLMLEDACKNQRKHSASVVVAGGARDEEGMSLLLCEETIPGSPAPDEPPPPRLPFASATHSHAEERRADAEPATAAAAAAEPWRPPRDAAALSPRERRVSERDSTLERERKEEDDDGRLDATPEVDKPIAGGRSRKASESSCGRRGRRRRDTDEPAPAPPLKYNFYVDLDPAWDNQKRISVLTSRLADLRKAYHSVKAELAAIDRRRKKLRRKEREAVKAAKAACS